MEDIILQRIKELIKVKSSSPSDFASKCNIPQTSFCRYINQGKTPTIDKIVQILATFPDVSAEWLLRGVGTMYHQPTADVIINGPQHIKDSNYFLHSPHAQASTEHSDIIKTMSDQLTLQAQQIKDLTAAINNLTK